MASLARQMFPIRPTRPHDCKIGLGFTGADLGSECPPPSGTQVVREYQKYILYKHNIHVGMAGYGLIKNLLLTLTVVRLTLINCDGLVASSAVSCTAEFDSNKTSYDISE